jgi:uncharacterized membrane protein YhaH (DUF805 family)
MFNIVLILLLASPLLLLATYLMLAKRKSFWKIFTVHTLVFIAYMTFVANYSKLLTGHDEYGLGQLGLGILFIILHIIIGFVHGLFVTLKRRQTL